MKITKKFVRELVNKVDENILVKVLDDIDDKRLGSLFYGGPVIEMSMPDSDIFVRISAVGDVIAGLYRCASEDRDSTVEDVFEVEDRGDGGLFGMRAADVEATNTDEKLYRLMTTSAVWLTTEEGLPDDYPDGYYVVRWRQTNAWLGSCYFLDRPNNSVWEVSFGSDNLLECIIALAEELLKEVKNRKEANA